MEEKTVNIKTEKESIIRFVIKNFVPPILTASATCICAFLATNSITNFIQKQTQVVIEPREGDIIVDDGDNGYKLLQLIKYEDISFPTKLQEIQHSAEDGGDNRVEVGNINNESWENQDSFSYMINTFSINSNKVINLLQNINYICLYVDFYQNKNISTLIPLKEEDMFYTEIYKEGDNFFNISLKNIESQKRYVTKELNNGFEWAKIRLNIEYSINNKTIKDCITSDWMQTDQDF